MKKKLLIALIVLIIMVSISFIFKSKSINNETEPSDEKNLITNTYYDCSGETYQKEDYTIYNNIKLQFENEKITYGSKIQIYEFKTKEKYDEFKIEENDYFKPNLVEKDDKKLTITYEFINYQRQEETETRKQYIKKIEKQGYKCEIVK